MPEREAAVVNAAMRLDQFLVQTWPGLDRQLVRQMIASGGVFVNGQPATKAGQYLATNDEVAALVDVAEPAENTPLLSSLPLSVLYEDEVVLVVDKLAGVPMHPTRYAPQGTLAQQLAELYPHLVHVGGVDRGGLVMRIEPEVSGAVLVAKDEETYRALQRLVKHDRVECVYSILVEGRLTGEDVIDQPIGNVKRARQRLAVAREGRPSQTCYRAQRHYKDQEHDYSLLEVRPRSGRLHQIRVHFSWYGFPLVGDRVYGSRQQPLLPDRIFQHVSVVAFPHPRTGEIVRVESPLAPELRSVLRYLTRSKSR
ncbi:MAG TPA: RluA family pseudouridine synthase [Anaerolineae bacterium]|mgnify:CR=1 FL=1|nr:RluA family pseudouridine synthase [Anaerolineae bacterium]HQI86285.1 RluA family pseudouridine synthase [Anaerolineae bacterium]